MSVHVISWVLKSSEATGGERLVLLSLADHARDDGSMAWPSVATIARDARLSRRAVQSALRRLEADGRIVKVGESKAGTNIYDVQMAHEEPAEGREDFAREDSSPAKSTTENESQTSPEPSVEPSTTTPPNPPRGASRGRVRSTVHDGAYEPDAVLDDFTRAAYARMGINLPAGATHADAERATNQKGAA